MPAFTRDPELYAQPTTWPGAKLPHTWVTRDGHRVSTLDLAGHGTFSVWTGIGGQAWLDAAEAFSAETGLPVTLVSVGPGQPFEDPYGTWAELREISDGGVLAGPARPVRRGPPRERPRLRRVRRPLAPPDPRLGPGHSSRRKVISQLLE